MTNIWCNYDDLSKFVKPSRTNYIPVKNYRDFTRNVYTYYNQYCAPPKITQERRILRNYINNQNSIKKSNINPFFNNKNKIFNFLYTEELTYMLIQNSNKSVDTYILINNQWCPFRRFNGINCKELENFLKRYKKNDLFNYNV
jgi:hypothetical protein